MSTPCILADLPIGAAGVIHRLNFSGSAAMRLREMGLLNGTRVKLVRWAPLGDPVEIEVRGYHLSLRRHEAEKIELTLERPAT
jgi:ferrous iron transport protein A